MSESASDKIVQEAKETFDRAVECENDNRILAKEDILFARMGEQWETSVLNERKLAGRPCLTINKLLPVIRQVVNDSRQNRPSIKVHPCDSGADPETAEIMSGIIRNIEASSDADVAYDTAIENAVSGGFGYWRVNTDYALNAVDEDGLRNAGAAAFDQDIYIRRIANAFSVFGDPYSQAADSSDWNQCHIVESMTRDQFKEKYPKAEETDFDGSKWADVGTPWKDGENIQVCEYWKRRRVIKQAAVIQMPDSEEGPGEQQIVFENEIEELLKLGGQQIGNPRPVQTYKVTQYMVSGCEVLETTEWPGAYIPIVPVYGDEVNVEGKRHFRSLIRDAKDAQRMFNYWRTTATETVALAPRAPYIGPKGFAKSMAGKWATANSQSHAYLEYDGAIPPQRQSHAGVPSGMMQEALSASDDIKAITGIYDASLGARSNETSGVAIRNRQMEGDVSTFHFIDNLTRAIRHSGRILIDLIPKVYSSTRIVRILGEDGKAEVATVNGEPSQDDPAAKIHDIRTGRYDLTVTAGPSFTTRREEASSQMIELIRAFPDAAPVVGDLLAKNLDWPGADEIAKRLENMLPPEARGEEGQQQMQQMQQVIQDLSTKLQAAEDKKQIDQGKLQVEAYKAETDRMTAMHQMVTPQPASYEEVAPQAPSQSGQRDMGQAY